MLNKNIYNIHTLIIDDDKKIASLLKQVLYNNNFVVTSALNTSDAGILLHYFKCDLILLDYMLGMINGIDFLKTLRSKNITIPVIMLTAVNAMDVKIESLSLGADDYISKPFNSQELIIRMKNLVKRSNSFITNQIVAFCNMQFNQSTGELKRNNDIIQLSTQEEQLLQVLTKKLGQVVTKEEILENYGKAITEENLNTINVNIMRLRKKIEDPESNNQCLKTIRNQGFLLKP